MIIDYFKSSNIVLGYYLKQCTNAQMTNDQHVEDDIVYWQVEFYYYQVSFRVFCCCQAIRTQMITIVI